MIRLAPLALLLLLSTINVLAGPDSGQQWWSYVQHLAGDDMKGRLTGTADYRRAAEYVVSQLKMDGVVPKGEEGYLQPVNFDVQRIQAAQSHVALIENGHEQPIHLNEDAVLGSRLPQPKRIEAPLIFIGYGLHIPEAHYDDLAGLDLRGKIVGYLYGGPGSLSSTLKAHSRSAQEFSRALETAGAVGAIGIQNPKSMDIPWSRMELAASQPGMRLADEQLQDTHRPMFTMSVNPAHAEMLFAGSGHSFADLLALADRQQPLPRFPLTAKLRATVTAQTEQVESPNVVGVIPGSVPKLRDEYVVLSAHLDHLGVGEPIRGDAIYNGAMDDASGVATLLEIAHEIHERHPRLDRSLLLVVVCGEEKGLLGSRYFAAHPTVPVKSMVADLNTDMFLPIIPLHAVTVYGLEESTLGGDVRAVASSMGIEVEPDRQPDRNIFIRSDQYNFIRDGIPSIMTAFAAEPGTPEAATLKNWLTERYHAPSDDTNQPVNLQAAAKFNDLILRVAEKVADTPAPPKWNSNSFFRRFERS